MQTDPSRQRPLKASSPVPRRGIITVAAAWLAANRRVAGWSLTAGGIFVLALGLGLTVLARSSPPALPQRQAAPVPRPRLGAPPSAVLASVQTAGLTSLPAPLAKAPRPPLASAAAAEAPAAPVALLNAVSPVCETQNYGTCVAFLASPVEAGLQAQREQKLAFLLHISGNFEDKQFT